MSANAEKVVVNIGLVVVEIFG